MKLINSLGNSGECFIIRKCLKAVRTNNTCNIKYKFYFTMQVYFVLFIWICFVKT